jgi:hypothetical protein
MREFQIMRSLRAEAFSFLEGGEGWERRERFWRPPSLRDGAKPRTSNEQDFDTVYGFVRQDAGRAGAELSMAAA